jgi:hypothetical protein
MKVHNDVANVLESEMVHAEVSQPATDTELDPGGQQQVWSGVPGGVSRDQRGARANDPHRGEQDGHQHSQLEGVG